MKNFVVMLLFAGMLVVSSVTALHAAPTAGCDPDFRKAQRNYAEAKRVENKAIAHQVIKRPDPSLGMTCFDKAIAVTSRLGNIFSDVTSAPPAYNTTVFKATIYDTSFGAGKFLSKEMNNVVTPVLSQYLSNFTGTISEMLGTTLAGFLNSVMGPIDTAISDINTYIASISGSISSITTTLNTIVTIANNLSIPMPMAAIASAIAALNAARTAVSSAMAALQTAMNTAISAIMSTVMSYINSILGAAMSSGCDHVKNLWSDGDPTSGAASVEGNGIEVGTPYFTYDDLLSGAPSGAGTEMLVELATSWNQGVLTQAMDDMTNMFAAPGNPNLTSWKAVPALAANPTVSDIITCISGGC